MAGKVSSANFQGTVDYAGGAATGDFKGTKAGAAPAGSSANAATGVTGDWDVTSDAGSGWVLSLTQDGSAVSGMLKGPDRQELSVKGTLVSNALDLAVTADNAAGTLKATLEGGALKGKFDIAGSAGAWSATRKP